MAFNKIQPEQVQQPTFFSDSGDLNISQTDTGVQLNVSKNLTGNFSFTGDLLTNGKPVFGLANTGDNFFIAANDTALFEGSNTQIRGTGNYAFMARNSQISGFDNSALNVTTLKMLGGEGGVASSNTALHGRGITFASNITGSVVLKDFTSSSQFARSNHAFYSNFESGHFFEGGDAHFDKSVSFGESGIFSGDLNVIGGAVLSGATFVNEPYLQKYANGERIITGSQVYETGFQLPAYTGINQGAHFVGVGTSHITTGALAISGHTLYICVGGTSDNVPKWAGIPISGELS